jgi:DNA-binding transcriptional ArsR family regulator
MNFAQQNFSVKIFKLLSNANRLKIIDLLSKNSDGMTVNKIAELTELEFNNTSNHLVRLRENGILQAKQSGNEMYYQIKDQRAVEIMNLAKKVT